MWSLSDKSILTSSDAESSNAGLAYRFMKCVFLSSGSQEIHGEDSVTFKWMSFCKGTILEKRSYLKHPFFMCLLSSTTEEVQ